MPHLPVEVAATLWADAYRETLRRTLERKVSEAKLAVLGRAVAKIEQRVYEGEPRQALSA